MSDTLTKIRLGLLILLFIAVSYWPGCAWGANEIAAFAPGVTTAYSVVRQADGDVWYVAGQVFEVWGTSGRTAADYDIALTDKSGGMFVGDFDTNVAAQYCHLVTHYQEGGAPADTDPVIWQEYGYWSGTTWNALSVNVTQISGDSAAADNLEAMFDGTGYLHDTAPASRNQIAALAGGVTILQAAESSTVTNGTETNTYVASQVHDATEYIVTDDGAGQGIDFYLQFDLGEAGLPVNVHLHGYYDEGTGATNSLAIQAYNVNLAAYQTIETLANANAEQAHDIGLTVENVDSSEKVKIRFVQTAQEASSAMHINHIYVGYVNSAVTAAEISDAVWDELVADHTGEATFGGEVQSLDPNLTLIKAVTDVMQALNTTVSVADDANSFTLADGNDVNDFYVGMTIYVQDATTGDWASKLVRDWATGGVVTVDTPLAFIPEVGDVVVIWGLSHFPIEVLNEIYLPRDTKTTTVDDRVAVGAGGTTGGTRTLDVEGDDPP